MKKMKNQMGGPKNNKNKWNENLTQQKKKE